MMLTKWKYDNEYNDGLVQDPHGAWYYTAEVDVELAALRAELAQWMGIFGEHDQPLPALDRARTMWNTLKTKADQADQAARYGQQIVDLEQQLAAVTRDCDTWKGDASSHLFALCEKQAEVNSLEQQLAQVIAERDAAETRNENYRLKLHTRDQQLAEVQERYESLKERS